MLHTRFRAIAVVVFLAAAAATGLALVGPEAPASGPQWLSLEEAHRQVFFSGVRNTKKVIVDVYTTWCGPCRMLDANTLKHPTVAGYLNQNFICVKLNAEQRDTIRLASNVYAFKPRGGGGTHEAAEQLATVNGRMLYPTLTFLDEGFNLIQALPGYRTPEELLPVLVFIARDFHKSTTWEAFKAQWDAGQLRY